MHNIDLILFDIVCNIIVVVLFEILFSIVAQIVVSIVHDMDSYCSVLFNTLFSVQHKSLMPASEPLLHHRPSSLSFSKPEALFRTAIARRYLAALFPIPGLASSSARSSLTCRGHRWTSFLYLATALVHLNFAGTCREIQGTMHCWHFSLDLPTRR